MSRIFRSLQLLLAALFAMSITVACSEQTAQKPAPPPDTRKADEAAIRANSADWSKARRRKISTKPPRTTRTTRSFS